jgi:hypothetical protein
LHTGPGRCGYRGRGRCRYDVAGQAAERESDMNQQRCEPIGRPPHGRARRRWRAPAAAVACAVGLTCGSTSVSAEPAVEHDRFEYFDQFQFESCGVVIDYEQGGRIWEMIGAIGPDGLAVVHFRLNGYQAYTNTDTGRSMTLTATLAWRDIRVIDNGDGTVTITSQNSLNNRVRDDEGRLISRFTGMFMTQAIIDLNGTPQDLDDDIFVADLGVVRQAGIDELEGEFCDDFLSATG